MKRGEKMLPSEVLREVISKKYNINLEKYAWKEEFKKLVFSIKLDNDLETNATTLGEIYSEGFNIGHCGLTSRYIARGFEEAELYFGKAKLLIGTKKSPNGEHAWTIINDYLIDSTLMICIPKSHMEDLGYKCEKHLEHSCARLLSEYDVYDHEYEVKKLKK